MRNRPPRLLQMSVVNSIDIESQPLESIYLVLSLPLRIFEIDLNRTMKALNYLFV